MTISAPIYALPLPRPSQSRTKSPGKRKRNQTAIAEDQKNEEIDINTEYSAVITPEERNQRRLAGQDLHHPPPPSPFPHASSLQLQTSPVCEELTQTSENVISLDRAQTYSIRNRHLAVMTSILHKCLEQREYARASRALAVLLRTEIQGRTIDLRHAEFWGAAAEILLHDSQTSAHDHPSRQGFVRAKSLYNKLALQHPWHRSWPDVINAQDFKKAMFSLWIHVTCAESNRVQERGNDENIDTSSSFAQELQVKKWELGEAEAISKEMDSLMTTLPFLDDSELIKMRAMVALWIADLIEAVEVLETDLQESIEPQEQTLSETWLDESHGVRGSDSAANETATASRRLANTLFSRLHTNSNDIVPEEEMNNTDYIQ